ncbi:MAG TPA: alpha/beta hydrolase [Spirochaetota bacterium]|nr:alpha/beta hydrolase [Spirochaetota bacterium]
MGFREGHIEYPDGLRVRYRLNEHNNRTVAVFIHDVGESLDDYDYLFPYFDTAGIALNALELRGHGKSGGEKGFIRSFSLYAKDLQRFIFGNLQNRPVYIVTQGAGMFPAIRVALDPRFHVKGVILISPLCDVGTPLVKRIAIRILSGIMPRIKLHGMKLFSYGKNRADGDVVCADGGDIRPAPAYSAGFYSALFREIRQVAGGMTLLRDIPSLVIFGEDDRSQSKDIVESVFKRAYHNSQKLTFCVCKKCGHGILHEKERFDFIERIIKWIHRHETSVPDDVRQ